MSTPVYLEGVRIGEIRSSQNPEQAADDMRSFHRKQIQRHHAGEPTPGTDVPRLLQSIRRITPNSELLKP